MRNRLANLSLVEWLVLIAMGGMLLSLMLPPVQSNCNGLRNQREPASQNQATIADPTDK